MTDYRVGHGYDLHRLEPVSPAGNGRPMILGGVRFDEPVGPVGHSDGDAVYHAVTDAILGALAKPDIGQLFPDTDPKYAGADSSKFVEAAAGFMHEAGYELGNLDVTVICERPKISVAKAKMIDNLAALLLCERTAVNVKGKTHEKVDAVGEGRAVEVHVIVGLRKM